jgi:hypothetical protein
MFTPEIVRGEVVKADRSTYEEVSTRMRLESPDDAEAVVVSLATGFGEASDARSA